jgi:hypothetical protein
MPEPIRYRIKVMQSGIFLIRYRTEMTDAGMPMPALVSWMPMPTYDNYAGANSRRKSPFLREILG